ncbi:transcription elongation factor B polypeptide 3-like [Manduca sexta]|uniref:transcription elongation factor B polypeptide 3-like n=1 Tax=Manduca sexta TaxID=7130 RepID=UPI00188DEC6F|nr:transcription elongation factor B polypeptide 3-like [Manduca sexta]
MATVLDSIKRYQHIIESNSDDEHKILKCINRLYHLAVTVQHLQDTGVGRTINALRKDLEQWALQLALLSRNGRRWWKQTRVTRMDINIMKHQHILTMAAEENQMIMEGRI